MFIANNRLFFTRITRFTMTFWCFFLSGLSSVNAAQSWQTTPFIINSFYETVLGSEYGSGGLTVKKWSKAVNIYVAHQVPDVKLHNELLNAQIADLRAITGLSITRVNNKSAADIQYYFTSQRKLPGLVSATSGQQSLQYIRGSVCLATMKTKRSGQIHSAMVYIPVDQARMHAKLLSCVVEELTQTMGIPRDSDAVYPSIFNDKSPNNYLTGLDVVLLKLLYSSEVKQGMTKAQLKPVLTNLIAKMRREGVITSANRYARSLRVCRLAGC